MRGETKTERGSGRGREGKTPGLMHVIPQKNQILFDAHLTGAVKKYTPAETLSDNGVQLSA